MPADIDVTTSDGVRLAVHELGGSGRPLVLAHATGLHGLVWQPLAAAIGDGARCVAFDHRGHGDSASPPALDFDWNGLGRDVLAVVDGVGLHRPVAFGHSSGGAAVLLAEEARPGTFEAIYCYEPVLVPADPPLGRDEANWLAAGARRRREVFESREEAYRHYAAKPPFDSWSGAALGAYVDHGFEDLPRGGVRLKCRRENEARIYEMATAHDGFARLDKVRCSVMLARGSDSEALAPAAVEAQSSRLPDSRTEVLAGLGHFGPLQDPAAAARSVLAFLTLGGFGPRSSPR